MHVMLQRLLKMKRKNIRMMIPLHRNLEHKKGGAERKVSLYCKIISI
jgi:hypothetical protein